MFKKILLSFVCVLVLASCGGSGSGSNPSDQTTMPVPNLMATLEGGTLSASIEVYNASGSLEYEGGLTIDNGQVSSDDFTLSQGQSYNFVITFNYTTSAGDTMPVAYVRVSQQIAGDSVAIAYTENDISYDLLEGISNDLSPSFNIGGSYVIPNLDSDGDGVSNIRELITGTDPFDANDTPDLITTNLDDEASVSGTLTLVATYNGNARLTSLYMESPALSDVNNEASIYQTTFNTTSFDDGANEFTFVAIKENGEEVRVTKTFQFDNYPNVNFFGLTSAASQGQPFTLVWDVDNADTVTIDNGIGSVDAAGQSVFTPSASVTQITFNITASKTDSFTTTQSLTVYLGSTEDGQDPASGVNLVWNPIESATGYSVDLYSSTDCSGDVLQSTTSTSASVSVDGLESRTLYSYKVTSGGSVVFACQQIAVGDEGIVGWWKFNEGEGTTSSDLSGQGNHATLEETQWDSDSIEGLAVSFDGVDDVVEIAESGLFDSSDDFSFEFWVNVDAASGNDTGILTTSPGIENTSLNGARIKVGTLSESSFEFGAGFNSNGDYGANDNSAYTSEWNHIVMTHSSEGEWQFYINGYRVRRVLDDFEFVNSGLSLGRYHQGTAFYYFKGLIDELVVYNRVLTTQEIRDNCQLNDGSDVCAADDVPTIVWPENGDTLTQGRFYYHWEDGTLATDKEVVSYNYCLENAALVGSSTGAPTIIQNDTCSGTLANDDVFNSYTFEDLSNYSLSDDVLYFKVRVRYNDGTFSNYSNTISVARSDTIVGWWKFDAIGTSSSQGVGVSIDAYQGDPNKVPAASTGSCLSEDVSGQNIGAICLDGYNDFMLFYTGTSDVTNDNVFDLDESFTIVARVQVTSDTVGSVPVFSRWNSYERKRQYLLLSSVDGARGVVYNGQESSANSSSYESDGWQFIIMTYDENTMDYPLLYVNGELDVASHSGSYSSANITSYSAVYGDFYTGIGMYNADSAGAVAPVYFRGAIDEIMVTERKINANEALNIYCAFEAELASSDSSYEMPEVCTQ